MKVNSVPNYSLNMKHSQVLSASMTFSSHKESSNPQRTAFLPLKTLYQFHKQQKPFKQASSKMYRSLQKVKTLIGTEFIAPVSLSQVKKWNSPPIKFLQTEKLQQKKHQLQKIKSEYLQNAGQNIHLPNFFKNKNNEQNTKHTKTISENFQISKINQNIDYNQQQFHHNSVLQIQTKIVKKHHQSIQTKILLINNRHEQFYILKYIDEGSYGKVYLVMHKRSHSIFCLKCIKKSQLDDYSLNQLIRQIKIHSFVSNPHIINLYGYCSDSQNVYLLLEPCLGQNLFKKLRKGFIKEKEVRKYMKQICTAVQYMHKNDIIHRDIKPENILVHEKVAKLCDFGWAVHSPLLRNTQCGTPLYTPPQMVKKQYYDNKIDVWCIGVLAYELLYGTIPFKIKQPNDLIKIVEQQVYFSMDNSISDSAKDFIFKCMAKNPFQRMSIRQVLQHQFISQRMEQHSHTYS